MKELTVDEMAEVQGGGIFSGVSAKAGSTGVQAITAGNVALALNLDVNVLSGNGSGGGINAILLASAEAGTVSLHY